MTVILGIDPGLQKTGWGVISSKQNQLSFVACGTIKTNSKADMPTRIKQLHDELSAVIERHQPEEAALEETFVNMSGASSLKLGQARGALMLTVSLAKLPLSEYSATMVKKSVVGKGHADKGQIAMMVKTLLPTSTPDSADSADALAVAITHSHHRTLSQMTGS
ncbi:MAG: crossover junction endodeoxyribonuclease RuvC [Rickettsiales bacterium]